MRVSMAVCVGLMVACGGSTDGPGNTTQTIDCGSDYDLYTDGLSADGTAYRVAFRSAEPSPPDRGDNAWVVEVTDLQGASTPEVVLSVEPFMPEHGHGTSPSAFDADVAGDAFVFEPIDLFMPGLWVVTFYVDDGVMVDAAEFRFCLEG